MTLSRHCATEEATEAAGAALARALPPGAEGPAVAYLEGDLGAGKTTLARGFLRALGVACPIRSPTYALVEAYEAGGRLAVHLDLYRLRDPDELPALGLRDWHRPGVTWLVEWPDKGAGHLPPPDLTVSLTPGPGGHAVVMTPSTPLGERWLASVSGG